MADPTKHDRVRALEREELRMVYWVCQGIDPNDLANRDDLEITVLSKSVEGYLTQAYKKLKIEGKKGKYKRLRIEYRDVVNEIVTDPQQINTWIPIPLPADNNEIIGEIDISTVEQVGGEDETEIEDREDFAKQAIRSDGTEAGIEDLEEGLPPDLPLESISSGQDSEISAEPWIRDPRYQYAAVGVLLLVVILLLITIGNLLSDRNPVTANPTHTPTITHTVAISGISTPGSEIGVATPITGDPALSTLTNSPTVTITPTPTITPSPTITPTPTPTLTPRPTEVTLFFDDFDREIHPAWQITIGSFSNPNGRLTPKGQSWIALKEFSEKRYRLEFDYELNFCSNFAPAVNFVALRTKDDFNFFGWEWDACDDSWMTVTDSSWDTEGDPVINNQGKGHMVITADEDYYEVSIDGRKISSITYTGYPGSGGIGLFLSENAWIDNFKITALP